MKKTLFLIAAIFTGIKLFAQTPAAESAIYNDLNSAYLTKFYPGVVEKANQLEKNFPQSALLVPASVYKGEALIYMELNHAGITVLEQVLPQLKKEPEQQIKVNFLLGLANEKNGNNIRALNYYYDCAKLSGKKNPYYDKAILHSGNIYYSQEDYENSLKHLEYTVTNGSKYSKSDFDEALQKFCVSCNKQKKYKKTVNTFNQLKEEDFSAEVYFTLCIYAADAYKELNQNAVAYDYYCRAIECGIPSLAVVALKKAYVLSSEKNIGVNPAEVFSKTTTTFSQTPELVREFWIRLGIDEYNRGNYKNGLSYFGNAEKLTAELMEDEAIITLYKAKIKIDETKDFKAAEKLLEENVTQLEKDRFETSDSWYSTLLSCKVNLNKWNEVTGVYNKIKTPDVTATYQLASFYYHNGDYKNVINLLGPVVQKDTSYKFVNCAYLYGSALSKNGEINSALRVYKTLNDANKLDNKNKLEYAKALFLHGSFTKAYDLALASKTSEGNYVAGLCQINLQNWQKANSSFVAYIKDKNSLTDFNYLAFFYKGYSEYCIEDYKNAYVSFLRFTSEQKDCAYLYVKQAYEFAAKSALQNASYKQAAQQAEGLVRISMSDKEKQESIIFLCDIYTDSAEYDKAIKLLEPYANSKNDFTVTALFKTANIYEKKNDLNNADKIYQKIYTDYPRGDYAQEAMYRAAEIFYSHEDFASSQKRFSNYIYRNPDGKYIDAALYFCGDCDLKLNRLDEAVMLNTTLLSKYPKSTYVYGTNLNLLETYYKQEDYAGALGVAKNLVKNYPEQAASDGIGNRLIQLEKIVSGTDKSVAEKLSEYEKNKKARTYEGRVLGWELVQLYARNDSSMADAISIAQEVLANHKEDSKQELEIAASCAEFIADNYSKNGHSKNAAELYLKAAEYYRGFSANDKAATSLYSAAQSFIEADLTADARETVEVLKQLYPESKQAKAAVRLIK